MKSSAFIFIVLVAISNICLNYFVRNSVDNNLTIGRNIISKDFLLAFTVGVISIICLLQVYRSNVNLAQGILLMGAISIIIGSIFSAVYFKQKYTIIEMLILIVLSLLIIYRWYLTNYSSTNNNIQ